MNPKDWNRIQKALADCRNPKNWSPKGNAIALRVNCKRDEKGNPRHGWAILSCRTGDLIEFMDPGHRFDLTRKYPRRFSGPVIEVGPKEYNQMVKEGSKAAAIGCNFCGTKKAGRIR